MSSVEKEEEPPRKDSLVIMRIDSNKVVLDDLDGGQSQSQIGQFDNYPSRPSTARPSTARPSTGLSTTPLRPYSFEDFQPTRPAPPTPSCSPAKGTGWHQNHKKQKLQKQEQDQPPGGQPGPNPDDFPDGGTQAWLVATGAAGIMFCTLGYANSFGVFQAHYMLNQLEGTSSDAISWIGSVQIFLVFATGMIGGPFFDRYGAWILRPAGATYLVSVMLTSFCKAYWHFMLVQGVLAGISCGLLMFPSVAALPQYFYRKRGAAMGIAVAGSSLGGIVFPIMLSRLLVDIGFGWAVRACGLIMVPFLIFAVLAVRPRLPPRDSDFFLWSAFRMARYVLLTASVFCLFIGMFTPMFYLPMYGIMNGMGETLASNLIAIINGASVPGRILPGILGDKAGRINILALAGTVTSMLIFCWPAATSTAGIIGFSVAFGFASGAIISGGPVVFSMCPANPKDIGTYMGMGTAVSAIAILIGPPINGRLLDIYHGFEEVSLFSGTLCLAGSILAVLAKLKTPEGILGKA